MNHCHFMGYLARDPELRQVGAKGTSVVNFTIGQSKKFKRANGTVDKETNWIDCEAWDTGAEAIAKYFKKGDPIIVHASAKTESWEKDGKKFSRMKFRVNSFEFPLSPTHKHDEATEESTPTEEEVPF